MVARVWNGGIAVLVLVALVVQLVIAVRLSNVSGPPVTGRLVGTDAAGRVIRVLSFFTVESNVLSGIVSAQLARHPHRDGRWWRAVRLAALLGIIVTGVVYTVVLAPVHDPLPGAETFVNVVFHYVIPLAMVAGWLAFGPRPRCDTRTLLWSLSFPVLWLAYTLVRGAIWGWYPYPFVDVPAMGYARVALSCLAVVVLFAVVALLVGVADRRLPPTGRAGRLDSVGS